MKTSISLLFITVLLALPFLSYSQVCPEDSLIVPLIQPTGTWEIGRKVAVAQPSEVQRDYKIDILPYDDQIEFNSFTGDIENGMYASAFQDKILTVESYEVDSISEVKIGARTRSMNYIILNDGTQKYRLVKNPMENIGLLSDSFYDPEPVNKLTEALVGKTMYTMSFSWDGVGRGQTRSLKENTRKFHPVKITRIVRLKYSIGVFFIPENDTNEYLFDLYHYRDPYRFISGSLSFCNPRSRISKMNKKTWEEFTKGNIENGINMDDVKLLLGEPDRKLTESTDKGIEETWVYYNAANRIYEITFLKNKTIKTITGTR